MASPAKDQQTENSSVSETDLDNETNSEGTSTSNPSEDQPSTFDVIMDAIKKKEDGDDDENDVDSEAGESDKTEDEKSKDGKSEEKKDESDEPSADELKAWKPKTRARFENLQAKYRDANERAVKAEAEAGHYRQFVEYLETNGIDQDEANKLFHIGALMKNDPFAALQAITPYYHDLLEITGQILPPDLQAQVKAGYLTQAHAIEISQGRAKGQLQPALEQEKQQRQQQRSSRESGQVIADMQSAIATWEQKWSTSDPDYNVKKERVLDRLELMLARAAREKKLPQTVEQAVALAEKAKKDVEADLRQNKPRKPVSMVDGGNATSSSKPEPKDSRELARRMFNV